MATVALNEFLDLLEANNPHIVPSIDESNCDISDCSLSVPSGIDRNTSVLLGANGYPYKGVATIYYNRFDYSSAGSVDLPFETVMTKQQFLDSVAKIALVNFKEQYLEDFTIPTTPADFNVTLSAKGLAAENYYCFGSITIRALYKPNIAQAFTALKFNGL